MTMSRTVYVNGDYLPEEEARISVFDRGFLFADGVYEVTSVLEGRLIDFPGHLERLHRSLRELEMPAPVDDRELEAIHRALVERNGVEEGMIYLQVTRGAAERDFVWPAEPAPSLVMFTQARPLADTAAARNGIRVITVPDIRWARRDIKTVQLLAPSMCKMMAKKAGCDDAWMVEDGHVTEGTSNNAWIVTPEGVLVTRSLSNAILHGITRAAVLTYAREAQIRVEERPFTADEARGAAEAFITAASAFVTPVVEIDGARLGDGMPGPVTRRLREIYLAESRRRAS
jgi:D-alanine transaminase